MAKNSKRFWRKHTFSQRKARDDTSLSHLSRTFGWPIEASHKRHERENRKKRHMLCTDWVSQQQWPTHQDTSCWFWCTAASCTCACFIFRLNQVIDQTVLDYLCIYPTASSTSSVPHCSVRWLGKTWRALARIITTEAHLPLAAQSPT